MMNNLLPSQSHACFGCIQKYTERVPLVGHNDLSASAHYALTVKITAVPHVRQIARSANVHAHYMHIV